MSRIITTSLSLAIAATTAVAVAGPASASETGTATSATAAQATAKIQIFQRYQFRHDQLALTVAGNSLANQARIVQMPWLGQHSQQWLRADASSGPALGSILNSKEFTLVNRNSGMCLDIIGGGSNVQGALAVQAPCDGTASQRWFTHVLSDKGIFNDASRYLFNRQSLQVLEVAGASRTAGAQVRQNLQRTVSSASHQLMHERLGGLSA